jgi:predicted TIM-barrel fold metal-dependent hydrolase
MSRIDVHGHFVPSVYRTALEANGLAQPDGIAQLPDWSITEALEAMDRLDISTAFLSISSPGVHFGDDSAARILSRQVNEEAADLVKTYPGRFGLFAATPLPDVEGSLAEIRYAFDHLAADGVVFETHFDGVYLGDSLLNPIYAELNARHATIFIHPTSPNCPCWAPQNKDAAEAAMALGYPRPMLEFMFETTRTVTNMVLSGVIERYPDINVIVPHAGATLPVLAGRIELLLPMLSAPGVPAPSLRSALRRLHFDLAGAPVPELLGALLQVADHDKIHYGSDWPFTPTLVCERLLSSLTETPLLQGSLRESLMHDNALRLFPRLSAALKAG